MLYEFNILPLNHFGSGMPRLSHFPSRLSDNRSASGVETRREALDLFFKSLGRWPAYPKSIECFLNVRLKISNWNLSTAFLVDTPKWRHNFHRISKSRKWRLTRITWANLFISSVDTFIALNFIPKIVSRHLVDFHRELDFIQWKHCLNLEWSSWQASYYVVNPNKKFLILKKVSYNFIYKQFPDLYYFCVVFVSCYFRKISFSDICNFNKFH